MDAQVGGFSFLILIATGGTCCPGTSISPSPKRHFTVPEAGPFEFLTAVKFQSWGRLVQEHFWQQVAFSSKR